ncbi:uncharacterized protein LOC8286055 isoform X2 [Ricinus communis]|uniref:uncharacterized protein LOC8286055 isoform X2 n=1 Tax=Ricinus communis TaxID=3988 RepID=UPI0007726D11|nr:uncharacterized protein LOC8286055 isoform X2 [Ricinus communis]|eukprot:XP_015579190.1 uncharacterized protein LOC8286055 isoform X2 [Ricinus communis]
MERLKSVIPDSIKQIIADSNPDVLPSTSSSLLHFLMNLSQFHQMIRDLVDPEAALCAKNKDAAMELKLKANKCYKSGDHATALACYSQALRIAPVDAFEMDKNLVATLYLNRASLFHKIGLLLECVRDCNRALQISPTYAKAWYRRGKANAGLGNYEYAVCDLNVAKNVELSFSGKKQIENELKIIAGQCAGSASRSFNHIDNSLGSFNLSCQMTHSEYKLLRVTTPDKGRGMASGCDIPQASLVHVEKPYALIVLKNCRDTHCHYCLKELPADTVPCLSCSVPLYCSQLCQVHAGGKTMSYCNTKDGIDESLPDDVKEHITEVALHSPSDPDAESFPEHKHECLGVNWPTVLPTDIVLAGRLLAKSISEIGSMEGTLDLSHSYSQINPEGKLELHIFAIVLLCCLQHSFGFELPINGVSLSQAIILVSQVRVNAMAVVRMKSVDAHCPSDHLVKLSHSGDALTSSVEQVPVGQAIYTAGSLFNHSCQPNVHAYFLSRTLFIRTTEHLATGCPLELSYGPQVGQRDCKDRLKFLQDKYSFRCHCNGCSIVNLSDLVQNAFRCIDLNCVGVVLDRSVINSEIKKLKNFPRAPERQRLDLCLQVDDLAHLALELSNGPLHIQPGCCLNCGSYCDLEAVHEGMRTAWIYFKRLQDAIVVKKISTTVITDASRALGALRSILHAYNKHIAEAEDILAQAFCLVEDFQSARDHCRASIKLSMGDLSAVDSINRLGAIFERYFGSHADFIFPYLQTLREKLAN